MQDAVAVPAVLDGAEFDRRLRGERGHRRAVWPRKHFSADDDERVLGLAHRLGEAVAPDIRQRFGAGAEIIVGVGERRLGADKADRKTLGDAPAFADAGVEHRRVTARIGADQQQRVGMIDAGDGRIEQITGAAPFRIEQSAILPAIDIGDAEPGHQILERENLFDGCEIASQSPDPLGIGARHLRGDSGECLTPARRPQLPAGAHVRLIEPLRAQAVDHVPGLVGNPFLVHVVIGARQDAHYLPAAGVDADRRAERVHHVDRLGLVELPRPRRERVRFRGQRPDRAEIDNVALQFRGHRFFEISRDLHVLAAADGAELGYASNFGGEADAACALDAAVHRGLDQSADVLVLDRALVLAIAALVDTVRHRLVLQIAFPALIANRAIERMIDQQKLHDAFARLAHHRRARRDHLRRMVLVGRQVFHAHRAGRLGLGNADNLDQTHAAIAGDRQPLLVAEARNFGAGGFARLQQRVFRRDVDLATVDDELGHAACPSMAPQRAVFHNCAAGMLSQPNA